MKQNKHYINIIMLFSTLPSYASGNDILPLIGLEFVLILIFIFFIFKVKINLKSKGVLFLIFVTTNLITFKLHGNLPYSKNLMLINSTIIGTPILSVLLFYLIIRKKQ